MFLLQLLLTVSIIFFVSLLVAELVLGSPAELGLPVPVRIGLGYAFVVALASASFKLLPIQAAWVLGAILLGLFLLTRSPVWLAARWQAVRERWPQLVGWYVAWLVLANLFVLPLHLARTYGPFTESGGDVSIYADISKYLVDHAAPSWGPEGVLFELRTIWTGLGSIRQLQVPLAGDNADSLARFDLQRGNPPRAEYATYRVAARERYPSIQFAPTATWFPLFGDTDYPVFYGVLAFQYAAMLLAMAAAARPFGRVPAALALSLGVASLGMVAVGYNVYFLQSLSLALTAIALAALTRIPVASWAGIRAYGLPAAIMTTGYIHFLTVVLPLLVARSAGTWPIALSKTCSGGRGRLAIVPVALTIALLSLWLVADGTTTLFQFLAPIGFLLTSLRRGLGLEMGSAAGDMSATFGEPVQLLSERWTSFFFGILSEQHDPSDRLAPFVQGSTLLGAACLVTGALVLAAAAITHLGGRRADLAAERSRLHRGLAVYLASLAAVALHAAITQMSAYTQAKGAQDVLVVLFTGVLSLPAMQIVSRVVALRWAGMAYTALVACFAATLLVPRAIYAWSFADGLDRGTILEASFFSEAARIRATDPAAFVLVEPTTFTDIYFLAQPFFGLRMLPTQHLVLTRIPSATRVGESVILPIERDLFALDFVHPDDLDHLWLLQANVTTHPAAVFPERKGDRVWQATRLVDATRPVLLLTGINYQRFSTLDSGTRAGEQSGFSQVRGGIAALVVPADRAVSHRISVQVQPDFAVDQDRFASAVQEWLDTTGGINRESLGREGPGLTLTYDVPASAAPRLIQLVRVLQPYRLSVRVDGRELDR